MEFGVASRSARLIAVLVATLLAVPAALVSIPAQAAPEGAAAPKAPAASKASKALLTTATGKGFSKGTKNGRVQLGRLDKSDGIAVRRVVVAPLKRKVTLRGVRWATVGDAQGKSRYVVRVVTSKRAKGHAVLRQAGRYESQTGASNINVALSKGAAKRVRRADKVYVAASQVNDMDGDGSWERFDTHSTSVRVGKRMVLSAQQLAKASNRVSGRGKATRSTGRPNMMAADLSAFQCPGSSNPPVTYPLTGNLKGAVLQCANFTQSAVQNPNLSQAQLNGSDFGGMDFAGVNLSGAQFQSVTLNSGSISTGVAVLPSNLTNANLSAANLSGTNFQNVTATGADLDKATLTGAAVAYANFASASLTNTDLVGAGLWGSSFEAADLTGANLSGTNLQAQCCTDGATPHWIAGATNLTDAKLVNANLSNALVAPVTACVNFGGFCGGIYGSYSHWYVAMNGVDLSGATLSAGQLQNQAQALQPSVNGPTKLQGTNLTPQFVGTSAFSGTNMNGVDFTGANFTGQDFGGTSIQNSVMVNADLTGVALTGADFAGVTFATRSTPGCPKALTGGDLRNASLAGARGMGCDFTGSKLDGADFTGARLYKAVITPQTTLGNTNFTGADLDGLQAAAVDFRFANLGGGSTTAGPAAFNEANLKQAQFQNTDLEQVAFMGANLVGANFMGADLVGAALINANLSSANLTAANLQYAKPTGLTNQAVCNVTTWFDGSLQNGPCQP